VETTFSETKQVVDTTLDLDGSGPLSGAVGPVSGYEIHMGSTRSIESAETPFGRNGESTAALGASDGNILGCYLHGLFENDNVRAAFVTNLFSVTTSEQPERPTGDQSAYDRAATLLGEHCSLDWLVTT
jgi:adenosylcobyric acid synthase